MKKRTKKTENNRNEHTKTLQLFLWTITILIQMTVVKSLEVKAAMVSASEITVYHEIMDQSELCKQPEDLYEAESGDQYQLLRWSVEPAVTLSVDKKVEEKVLYEQTEEGGVLPEIIEIRARDSGRQQTVTAIGQMEKKELVGELWMEGFVFPVTFHAYGSEYYHLGNRLIPYNEERPELEGCEELLLETIGVSPEAYRITYVHWSGEPYEDSDGSKRRDAMAFGQKLVRDYQVTYAGIAKFPAWNGWQTVGVYGPLVVIEPDDLDMEAAPIMLVEVEVKAENADAVLLESSTPSLWERITKTLMITIAIGAVLFLGGLLFLGLLRVAKKIRTCYNKKKAN